MITLLAPTCRSAEWDLGCDVLNVYHACEDASDVAFDEQNNARSEVN